MDVTASIGVYLFDGTESNYEEALQRADAALYYAKETGKNRYTFFDEVTDIAGTGSFHAFFPDMSAQDAALPPADAPHAPETPAADAPQPNAVALNPAAPEAAQPAPDAAPQEAATRQRPHPAKES